MKQFQKMVLLTMAVVFGLMGQADVYGLDPCKNPNIYCMKNIDKLRRSVVRYPVLICGQNALCGSLNGHQDIRRSVVRNSDLICGQNALCGTLTGSYDYVYGQVGIYMYSTDLQKNLFIPVYAMNAVPDGENRYKLPKWDGKIFWMTVDPNEPPKPLQPQFIDVDENGVIQFVTKVAYYIQEGKDYSAYIENAALCNIHITADSNRQVTDYTMDIYDQDGNLEETGWKLDIGDRVSLFHSGSSEDEPEWNYFLGTENMITVTQEPVFTYSGYIPGRDIGCTHCVNTVASPDTQTLTSLAAADMYFLLEGMNFDVAYEPVWSEKILLGKLKDMVPENPELITLTDVIEGLKVLALGDPQNFHFRDINGDNKFGAEEVIWLLRKMAGLP